jgi:para-aminobenzoate synthetase component 1
LKKKNQKVIAQPIKGTAKRSSNQIEDELIKQSLAKNMKEQTENIMIVDLVRNDLSRVSKARSVKVDELFGVYTFKQVHQLISTISCDVDASISVSEIIKQNFPMGSMTGAPKISAMQLIDEFENTKRGAYSGSVGYFNPNGDFDFNVVIRSLLYNQQNKYLSYSVGSAITIAANANEEYNECLLKAKVIKSLFN